MSVVELKLMESQSAQLRLDGLKRPSILLQGVLHILLFFSALTSLSAQEAAPQIEVSSEGRHQVSVKLIETLSRTYNLRYDFYPKPRSSVFVELIYQIVRRDPTLGSTSTLPPHDPVLLTAAREPYVAAGFRRFLGKAPDRRSRFFVEGAISLTLPHKLEEEYLQAVAAVPRVGLNRLLSSSFSPGVRASVGYQFALARGFTLAAQFGLDVRNVHYLRELQVDGEVRVIDSSLLRSDSFSHATSFLILGKRF